MNTLSHWRLRSKPLPNLLSNPLSRTLAMAVVAGSLALGLTGCLDKKVDFSIDNPTDAPLSVRIDQTAYDVPAHSAQNVSLPAGRHSIESPATGKLEFIVYAESRGGLINPTLSPYVSVMEVYAVSDKAATGFRPGQQTIRIDGVSFQGPFEIADRLFIDKTWTYGVYENFPESITSRDRQSQGNIKTKLFAKAPFLAYYETRSGDSGYYARHKTAAASVAPRPVPAPVELPVFVDPDMEAVAIKMKALYTDYARAESADEQARLRKLYQPLVLELLNVYAPRSSKAPVAENEKYNLLVQKVGQLFGESARVIS